MQELINGVYILNTNVSYEFESIFIAILIAVLFSMTLIVIIVYPILLIAMNDIVIPIWLYCITVCTLICMTHILIFPEGYCKDGIFYVQEKTYECYLDEDKISFKEFNEKCEVISQNGNIYEIKLKK